MSSKAKQGSSKAPRSAAPKKDGKKKSPKVSTAKEKSVEEQAKIARHWNKQRLLFVKPLGDGLDAVAVGVRLAAAGQKSLVFALREQVLEPAHGFSELGDELSDEDVAKIVRHLKNNRKCGEHAFILPVLAWTIVERDGKPVLLMAFPLCEMSLSKLLVEGGGKLPRAYKPFLKLWFAQIAMAVGSMHGLKVIHGDLHQGNVLLDRVHGYLQPFVADFGSSVDYSDTEQQSKTGDTLSSAMVTDVRCLGTLHCLMTQGTEAVDGKKLKEVKAADADEYRMMVTLAAGELPAREVVLLPWLQGPEKARQHPQFAIDLATKHPDHPLAKLSAAPLMAKLKAGNRGLRLREGVNEEEVLEVKAHEEGELVMCLSPFGVLCKTKGAKMDCPPGGLWTMEQFGRHQHVGKKVLKADEVEAVELKLTPEGKRKRELFEALTSTQYTGDPSLIYSKRIVFCKTHKRWADVVIVNDHDRLTFKHKCVVSSDCQEIVEDCAYPMHLGELVESSRVQAWTDSWIELFTAARTQRKLDEMPIVQLLRRHGIVWQEPTPEVIRKAINDALPEKKKPLEVQFEKLGMNTESDGSGSEKRKESSKKPVRKASPRKSGGSAKRASKAGSSKR